MVLSVCLTVGTAIGVAATVGSGCLDFLAVTDDKAMPKSQKVFRILTNALTLGTLPLAFAATVAKAPAAIRLALNGAAAAATLTQRVAVLSGRESPLGFGDYLDLGAGTLISVCGLVNDAIIFKPEFFGSQRQLTENVSSIGNLIGKCVETHVYEAWSPIGNLVKRFIEQPLFVVAPNQGQGRPCIVLAPINAEAIYHMQQMQTIDQVEEIPSLFHSDDVLKQFRCALSGKPIRHMLVVAGTESSAHPIWFESRAILQKIDQRQKPARRPEGIGFARENLREFPAKQTQIDTALNTILDELHRAEFRFEPLENFAHPEIQKYLQMVAILKAIGLERINTMQDVEICDTIVERVSPKTIANVRVNTIWHQFHAGEQPKPTKVIHLTPTVAWVRQPPLSEEELFAATRAALISKDQRDKKALLLAKIPFEIRVSTDLQDLLICSEFVRSDYERKTELLHMMKEVLQVDRLHDLFDDELADRIVAGIPKKFIVNVSVHSLEYRFAENPKPTRAIVFTPPWGSSKMESSVDSLFAAARFLFGSQTEIDKQELNNCGPFIIYVDSNFQDLDIKELENFAHPGNMVAILKAIGLERIGTMQDVEICDTIVEKVSPNFIADVRVNTIQHQFRAREQPKLTKVIRFTPTVTWSKPPLSEEELVAAARAVLLSQNPRDKRALELAQIPFEIKVSTNLQDIQICSEFVKSDYERKTELLQMMKRVLQVEQLQQLADDELADSIIARISKKLIVNVSVHSLAYRFAGTVAPKPTRSIVFAPPVRGPGKKVGSADSLFAAARFLFGSEREIDKQELKKCRTFIIYIDNNFQNIEIKEIL